MSMQQQMTQSLQGALQQSMTGTPHVSTGAHWIANILDTAYGTYLDHLVFSGAFLLLFGAYFIGNIPKFKIAYHHIDQNNYQAKDVFKLMFGILALIVCFICIMYLWRDGFGMLQLETNPRQWFLDHITVMFGQ